MSPNEPQHLSLPELDRRRLLASGAAVAVGGGLLGAGAARAAGYRTASPAAAKSSLTVAMSGPVSVIDPDGSQQNYVPAMSVIWASYDTLVSFAIPKTLAAARRASSQGLKPAPSLASSWTVSPDGRTYRFNLRNATSSHGNALTPEGVTWMVEKTLAGKATGAFLFGIMGVTDKSQVRAVGNRAVEFKLKAPSTTLLLGLGLPWFAIYDTVEVKKHVTADDPYASKWLRSNTAGFGPYAVESMNGDGSVIRLQARSDYWGPKPVQRVIQQSVADAGGRLQLLLRKQADYAEQLTPVQLAQAASGGAQVTHFASTTGALLIVSRKAPFDDPKVRQAIAQAIPYNDIVEAVYRNRQPAQAWRSPFAPFVHGYTGAYGYETDPAAAEAGLAGVKGAKLTISYSGAEPAAEQIGVILQGALKSAGLDVTLSKVIDSVYVKGITERKLPTFISTVQGPPLFPIPSYYLQLLYAKGGFNNYAGYENPEMESIVKKLLVERNPQRTAALARRAQQIAMRDLPLFPLVWTGEFRATSKGTEVLRSHTGNGLVYWQDLRST